MKKFLIALLAMVLLFAGCGKREGSNEVSNEGSGEVSGVASDAIPGSYTVPDGWVRSEVYSTDEKIFYMQEGHEDDEQPDNIAINVGTIPYTLEEHEQFRDTIVQLLLQDLEGTDAQLDGDGTYTKQGDLLYIFTIAESDVVTKQYYILKDNAYCLVQLTNFSRSEAVDKAAEEMADSFAWDAEASD